MQKLLTIVVPVYKVEQYINKCLDSCIIYKADGSLDEEKMNQLEVIIVNDGTPDNSAELSRVYTKRYPQTFRQIDKENGGHGSAWNVGLKEATGKYLRFLDSDDWLTNLDKLIEKLVRCEADVVLTHLNNYHEDTKNNFEWNITDGPFDVNLPFSSFSFENFRGKTNTLNFLFSTYKTSVLKPFEKLFMEKTMYDDSILYAFPLLFCKTYICIDLVLYNYLSGRAGQSMNIEVKKRNIPKLLNTYLYEMQFIQQHIQDAPNKQPIYEIMASDSCYLIAMLVYLPWKEFKHKIILCESFFHLESQVWNRGKQSQRYKKSPLFIFYLLEKIRQLKEK